MSAARTLQDAREAGLVLSVTPAGGLSYKGPREAFERLAPAIRADRAAIIATLAEPQPNPAAMLDAMQAENDRRRDWWRKPVQGWPDRLTIRSVVSGEATTINLRRER